MIKLEVNIYDMRELKLIKTLIDTALQLTEEDEKHIAEIMAELPPETEIFNGKELKNSNPVTYEDTKIPADSSLLEITEENLPTATIDTPKKRGRKTRTVSANTEEIEVTVPSKTVEIPGLPVPPPPSSSPTPVHIRQINSHELVGIMLSSGLPRVEILSIVKSVGLKEIQDVMSAPQDILATINTLIASKLK